MYSWKGKLNIIKCQFPTIERIALTCTQSVFQQICAWTFQKPSKFIFKRKVTENLMYVQEYNWKRRPLSHFIKYNNVFELNEYNVIIRQGYSDQID